MDGGEAAMPPRSAGQPLVVHLLEQKKKKNWIVFVLPVPLLVVWSHTIPLIQTVLSWLNSVVTNTRATGT